MAKHKKHTGTPKNLSKGDKKALKKLPKGVRDLVASSHGSKWSQKLLQSGGKMQNSDAKHTKPASQIQQQSLRNVLTKSRQRILVIGDGNFSFSAALIDLLNGDGSNVVATCYDSEEVLHKKYTDAKDHVEKILDSGGVVLYDVDGTRLSECSSLDPPYDCAVFNFPHVGLGIKDQAGNVVANQELVASFLLSAAGFIHPSVTVHIKSGSICVTVKKGAPYDLWSLPKLAHRVPQLRLKTAMDFSPRLFPGFSHRRTAGEGTGGDAEDNGLISKGAKTFVFSPDSDKLKKPSASSARAKSHRTSP